MSKGCHTRWDTPDEHRADPAYIEAGAAIALGQAVYDHRTSLGLTQADLAERLGTDLAEVERLEGGGTAPTITVLRALAAAPDARLDLSIDGEDTHLSIAPHAA
ncbi:helix-turn-helix transcriptional regulator [Streptomyces sp. T-3]|nr:helix-turn-helix transcriptional regulator [Streptomyces sp. T-3]